MRFDNGDTSGVDLGQFQLRAYWTHNYGWPRVARDAWLVQITAGPFLFSCQRLHRWRMPWPKRSR